MNKPVAVPTRLVSDAVREAVAAAMPDRASILAAVQRGVTAGVAGETSPAVTSTDRVKLTTRVPSELAAALAEHCDTTGRTQNWVVEQAIRAWLVTANQ